MPAATRRIAGGRALPAKSAIQLAAERGWEKRSRGPVPGPKNDRPSLERTSGPAATFRKGFFGNIEIEKGNRMRYRMRFGL